MVEEEKPRRGPGTLKTNPAFIEFRRIAREEGGSAYDIAKMMNLPKTTASRWGKVVAGEEDYVQKGATSLIQKQAARSRGRGENAELKREMIALWSEGKGPKIIAESLRVPEPTIKRWAKEMGLSKTIKHTRRDPDALSRPIPWDELSDEARALLEDFGRFRSEVLGTSNSPRRVLPWATKAAEQLLADYYSDEDEYDVVNVAPGLGKTTLITHDFVVWFVTLERAKGREPTIQLGHRAAAKSAWYVKRLRQTFTYNAKLIRLYGRFKPTDNMSAWSTTEIAVEPLNPEDRGEKEPTVTASSYEGSILSGRFKLIIWDDLIDKGNSMTVDAREQLKDWWAVEAETRLEPGGLLILSNARFGPEDLSQFVTEQVDSDDLDEDEQPRPFYNRIRFRVHYEELCDGKTHTGPWPEGCLLDPVRAGWKRIRRQELASEGRFRLVWQQEDTDPEGNLAEKVWFTGGVDSKGATRAGCFDRERSFGQLPAYYQDVHPVLSAVTIDPSNSRFWSVQHWLVYPGEIQVLLRAVRRPMQSPDLLYPIDGNPGKFTGVLEEFWLAAHELGVPFDFLIYEHNAQRGIVQMPFYQDWARARNVSMVMHETNKVNKHDPDNGVQMNGPMYMHSKVRLPYAGHEEKLYGDLFRREACAYPEGATSDVLMTHWFLTHRMRNLVVATVAEGAQNVVNLPAWVQSQATFNPRPAWAGGRNLDKHASLPA